MSAAWLFPLAVASALVVGRQLDRWERRRSRRAPSDPYFERTRWF